MFPSHDNASIADNQNKQQLNSIIGTYECKVDAKGRLMIPSALKKQLANSLQDGFVLKRSVFQPCLELYPMAEWNSMMQKINKLNRFVTHNMHMLRHLRLRRQNRLSLSL